MNRQALHTAVSDGTVALEPLGERHREGLRACMRPDDPVWAIYPVRMVGDGFDPVFAGFLDNPTRWVFAILEDGVVRGMTSYLNPAPDRQTVDIGGTFLAPDARGGGLNAKVKRLMIDRAFANGVRRIEFRIDERNGRSQAAVAKLGAVKEGSLRQERMMPDGHVRDAALWGLLPQDWRAASI